MADTEKLLTPRQEIEARMRVVQRQMQEHALNKVACEGALQVLADLLKSFPEEGTKDGGQQQVD